MANFGPLAAETGSRV